MAEIHRGRAAFKFGFWLAVSVALFGYIIHSYTSGQMIQWYYYSASLDGYAVDANVSMSATKDKPVVLNIAKQDEVKGLVAIPVAKGDRLPRNANGVISLVELKSGKRAVLEGQTIKVTVPWQIKETKGFKFKDTFKHKGIRTNPWSGAQEWKLPFSCWLWSVSRWASSADSSAWVADTW
ncbi:MAG: hypothetical protein H6Q48_1595 [Deltaproteobacteria bacterium]|nr:hypothetical protein [Deltaproteobacteria bacterium]